MGKSFRQHHKGEGVYANGRPNSLPRIPPPPPPCAQRPDSVFGRGKGVSFNIFLSCSTDNPVFTKPEPSKSDPGFATFENRPLILLS